MGTYDLSDAEKYIMKKFWQFGTMSSVEVTKRVADKNWNRSTLYTLLNRLVAKGMIHAERSEKSNTYVPLVTKEAYQAVLGHKFLDELYDGCAKDFLVSMISNEYLSEDDIKELHSWFVGQGGTMDD